MPTVTEHRAKANRHFAFLSTIPDDYPEWLVTVAFYAAVELIESLFAERGINSERHEVRNEAVRRHFPSLSEAFKTLYNASLDARYGAIDDCPSVAEVRGVLIAKHLKHVQAFVRSHRNT